MFLFPALLLIFAISDLAFAEEPLELEDSFTVEGDPRLIYFNTTTATVTAKMATGLLVTGTIYAYLFYAATVLLERFDPEDDRSFTR
jgi:hypothetical protein